MSRFKPPGAPTLDDPSIEQVIRELRDKLAELQRSPFAEAALIRKVSLADGVPTAIAHKLGRAPLAFFHSPPRGPSTSGRIEDVRTSGHDPKQFLVLEANGYGATVSVDVLVF